MMLNVTCSKYLGANLEACQIKEPVTGGILFTKYFK